MTLKVAGESPDEALLQKIIVFDLELDRTRMVFEVMRRRFFFCLRLSCSLEPAPLSDHKKRVQGFDFREVRVAFEASRARLGVPVGCLMLHHAPQDADASQDRSQHLLV